MLSPHSRLLATDNPTDWRRREWPEFVDHLVLTPEGVFSIRREGGSIYKRPAQAADFARIFGEVVKERLFHGAVELKHRVPYQLLLQAIGFFRHVWQQQRREDILLLYFFEKKRRYQLVHPSLKSASHAHVDYDFPITPEDAVRFGSIHSHGQEHAYHSSQDCKDDRHSPGVHVIVGHLDQPYRSVKCIASDGAGCFDVSPWDVFTEPDMPKFPPSWFIDLPLAQRSTKYGHGF